MYKLDGKRVVVTGAGSGLGRALALAMASRGCRVGAADINEETASETLEMVRRRGGGGEVYRVDVSKPEEVEAMADHFFRAWGGVDVLVNNAGVISVGFVGDIPLEDWEWVFGVNFWGMLYGCHCFIPRMKEQGEGYIVNVASAAGFASLLEMAPYNATKAAVISLSETLKGELAPHNIGVTVVCPMFFNTNLLENMRYTDEFEVEFSRTAFRYARMTADEVAVAVVKAVERRRLYVVPQFSGKIVWLLKRMHPRMFYGTMAIFNRDDIGRRMLLWAARKGLIQ